MEEYGPGTHKYYFLISTIKVYSELDWIEYTGYSIELLSPEGKNNDYHKTDLWLSSLTSWMDHSAEKIQTFIKCVTFEENYKW